MRKRIWIPRSSRSMLLIFLAFSLSLISCQSLQEGTPIQSTSTATLTPVLTPTSTRTATPSPTATHTPTPTVTPLPTATPIPIAVSIETSGTSVVQGGVWGLRLGVNQPSEVAVFLGDQPIPLGSDDGQLVALVGIDALRQPGPLGLEVRASTRTGQEFSFSTSVSVESGDFTTETISLPADRAALLDPAITVPEAQRLAEVCAAFTPRRLWQDAFLIPRDGPATSLFGTRRSYNGGPFQSYHSGIDLDGDGGEPVHAANGGVVALAEELKVRGNAVVLDHGWGVYSGYWHMADIVATPGQTVAKGDVIGHLGTTGLSTGTHLHWEIRVHNVPVDPRIFTLGDPLAIAALQE